MPQNVFMVIIIKVIGSKTNTCTWFSLDLGFINC